jgi:hypothetical protein
MKKSLLFLSLFLSTFLISNAQDIYSNILGVKFFNAYGSQISKNPTQISNYINQYFNSPGVLNPQPFSPKFPTSPKF